ncbi:hypothetical protein F25303_12954 [Fusarium sp. NRRL 25303]|nr:hypothetical protein F25303_12954 [Fusarium sp. NRRL 25303]
MPPRFHSLPPEIQVMILQDVSLETSTAPYAAVCRAWQYFFEEKNFRSLAIRQFDLSTFREVITPRRQQFVKHIWYRIVLPSRLDPANKYFEHPAVLWRADKRFTECIFRLWDIISLWKPENRITLELSAFSFNDWDQVTKQQRIWDLDLAAYKVHKGLQSKEPYHYDEPHAPYIEQYSLWGLPNTQWRLRDYWEALTYDLLGWEDIEFTTADEGDGDNVPYYIEEDAILPSVPVVSKFLIRNTQFRQIWPVTLSQIFESFDNIENITVERWASVDSSRESKWTNYASKAFAIELPVTVKTLFINGEKCAVFQKWTSKEVRFREDLATHLRQWSKNLEHISILDIIDARHFLGIFHTYVTDEDLQQLIRWPCLKTLTLTTDLFETQKRKTIQNLLCWAARAARKMPELRTLEIRSSRDAQCFFRYNIVKSTAEITWSGPVVDSTLIMKEWEKTSAWRNNHDIVNDF